MSRMDHVELQQKLLHEVLKADEETLARMLRAVTSKKTKLLTTEEASELIGVTTTTVRRYVRGGLLNPIRYNARRLRFDLDEVNDLINKGVKVYDCTPETKTGEQND